MPKSINISGKAGSSYNLEELKNTDTRTSKEKLLVQIWEWNPNLPKSNPHSSPNPPDPEIGQIWLSKLVYADSKKFKELSLETPDEE